MIGLKVGVLMIHKVNIAKKFLDIYYGLKLQ